jgi:RNA polymerase sigma-70 factor, ECF subfamily
MLPSSLPLLECLEPALIARWRTGDPYAGRCLLRQQVEPLRRYFSRRVPCRADAEDLVQRTLLATIDALPRFREDVELAGFMLAIASKLLLRYRRDGERARVRLDAAANPDTVQASQPSALAWVCREDGVERLRLVIRELPQGSAQLLHLRYWEERDATEIGELLGLNPNAVRARLHRARHEMRRMLAAMEGSEEGAEAVATSTSTRAAGAARGSTFARPHRSKKSR